MPDPVDRQLERYNAADAGMLSFSATFISNKQMLQQLSFDFHIGSQKMLAHRLGVTDTYKSYYTALPELTHRSVQSPSPPSVLKFNL